jgi:hypothetical protein
MEEGMKQSLDRIARITNHQVDTQASEKSTGLKALNKLAGNWKISGMAEGETTFECNFSRLYQQRRRWYYTYEADEDTVTMWMGSKDSNVVFRARWSDNGNTLSGNWGWPGGGYQAMMVRK